MQRTTARHTAASVRPTTASSLAQRHPATAFATLAVGLTWLCWIPAGLVAPDATWPMIVGGFGPPIGGAIMVRLHGGTIRRWLRDIVVFRVQARWYALALLIPMFDPAAQVILARQADIPLSLGVLPERIPLYVASFVFVLLIGGGQEELGWRGWLLPRLQERRSPLVASLLVGAVWAAWHLPLFVLGGLGYGGHSLALYVPGVVAASVVFTWLHNTTGGSVVPALLLHAQMNTASALVPIVDVEEVGAWFTDAVQIAVTVGFVAIAVLLVARHGVRLAACPDDSSRDSNRSRPPPVSGVR